MSRFEQQFFEYFSLLQRQMMVQPLLLGGATGSGGGYGGRPGGFTGYLPQTRIAYDLSEEATLITVTSGQSLLDNLNHIRARIQTLETASGGSGSIQVQMNDVLIANGVTIVNFEGSASVVDNGGGKVTVTVSGGGDKLQLQAPSTTTISDTNDYNIEWANYGDASSYFNSGEPTKIFFNKTGWYLLNTTIAVYLPNATTQAGSVTFYVVHSGDVWTEYYQQVFYSGCASNVTQTVAWPVTLYATSGDNIEINVYNDVGSNIRISGTSSPSNYETRITIVEL